MGLKSFLIPPTSMAIPFILGAEVLDVNDDSSYFHPLYSDFLLM